MILDEEMFEWSSEFRPLKYGVNFNACCGIWLFELSDDDIQSLKDGKVLCNDDDEYAVLIRTKAKRGEWISSYRTWEFTFECSVCGKVAYEESNFCPNCGADMRERKGDN